MLRIVFKWFVSDLLSTVIKMRFQRLVEFMQILIVRFDLNYLLLVGDNQSLPILLNVRNRLDLVVSSVVLSVSSETKLLRRPTCPYCRDRQLTVIHLDEDKYDYAKRILNPNHSNHYRMILFRTVDKEQYVVGKKMLKLFGLYNFVMVDILPDGNVKLWSWQKMYYTSQPNITTSYNGTEAIFHSNDTNALLFRNEMKQWPEKIDAAIYVNILPPYNFMVKDETSGQVFMGSLLLVLLTIIGDIMRFTPLVTFQNTDVTCASCYQELIVRNRRESIALFKYFETME